MSCYGNNILKTPNLDKLYAQSTRLTNFVVCPFCAPSRASLMTGRYHYRTGVWDTWKARDNMYEDETTIAEMLANAGYKTGLFGKWHLGLNYPMRPMDKGFQETLLWEKKRKRQDPILLHNGRFENYKGFYEDVLTDKAIKFIEKNADQPFFVYLPTYLPHDDEHEPIVPEKYIKPFEAFPFLQKGDRELYGMISKMDENIGKVLKALKQLNLENDTIVIFHPDNGPGMGSKKLKMSMRKNLGLRGQKGSVYEGGINVPCFIRWPGHFPAGKDNHHLAAHIDMLPTLLDICGVKPPKNVKLDGISVAAALANPDIELPGRAVFIADDRVETPKMGKQPYCVRGKRYKLVNGKELYDLQNDRSETNNIADKHPEMVAKLRKKYEKWFKETTAERNFIPGYTILGSRKQKDIYFDRWQRHSKGYRVKVISEGPYRITLEGIQHQLFPEGGSFCIGLGSFVAKKPIVPGQDNIVFDNVELQKGLGYFNLWAEGKMIQKRTYFGDLDRGHRNTLIELK